MPEQDLLYCELCGTALPPHEDRKLCRICLALPTEDHTTRQAYACGCWVRKSDKIYSTCREHHEVVRRSP